MEQTKQQVRKLTATGGGRTFIVALPIEHVRALGWKEHQKLSIKRTAGALVIRDWRSPARRRAK